MIDPPVALLHVSHGPEPTLLEYLYRVLLHLLAVGGLAVLLHRGSDVVGGIRAAVSQRRRSGGSGE